MRASSTGTICPGPRDGINSSLAAVGCTPTRTSNCRRTPTEQPYSTRATFPATPISTSCWGWPPHTPAGVSGRQTLGEQQLQLLRARTIGMSRRDWLSISDCVSTACRMLSNATTSSRILFPQIYDATLGNPVTRGWHIESAAHLSEFNGTGTESSISTASGKQAWTVFRAEMSRIHYYTWQPRVGFAWDLEETEDCTSAEDMDSSMSAFRQRCIQRRFESAFCVHTLRYKRILLQPKYKRAYRCKQPDTDISIRH